jgi:hypothetical protein
VRTIRYIQIYIYPVRTSQETHYVSAIKPNRLTLFRETVAVNYETIRNTQIHSVGRMQGFSVLNYQNKENEMGGACSTHGEAEIHSFGKKT